MREAVIVSTVRTPIGKAYRGALNATQVPVLAARAMQAAVSRAGLEGGEIVASRYTVTRDDQGAYALSSQQRTKSAQEAGRFDDEIVSIETVKRHKDKAIGIITFDPITLTADECARPGTSAQDLAGLAPVMGDGHTVTAGNASQMSDGASACVIMSDVEAARRSLTPLGVFRGIVVAGCAPEEMGIGPVLAIPRLLHRHGLKIDDIDLWEIDEAFAAQLVCCRDRLGIDQDKLNVNGGAISMGHPYGMSGTRMAGHILLEGRRRGAKLAVVAMCIGWGMGAAALFEIT